MGLVLSHGIGISLNILSIVPTVSWCVVVVPLMVVMNFQMGENKVYQSGDDRRMTTFGPSVASIASVMFPIVCCPSCEAKSCFLQYWTDLPLTSSVPPFFATVKYGVFCTLGCLMSVRVVVKLMKIVCRDSLPLAVSWD